VKHWQILIIFGTRHQEEIRPNDCSFGHFTLIMSSHYLAKEMQKS